MIRGTTPTLEFTLPFDTSLIAKMYITMAQNGKMALEKTLSDCNCSGTSVSLTLTQEDTLILQQQPRSQAEIILRGDQQRCNMYISALFFGNASPSEVKKGVTFTSLNGLKITGTADMSGGTSDNNCEAYLVDVTNPTVSFKTTSGTIKAYGYAYETTKSQWGGSSTTVYTFNGTNYYKPAYYGSPAATNITLGVSGGKLTGLPSGLSGGTLLVVRGI